MTSEPKYVKAGYYLEYLQFLNKDIEKLANKSRLDINWLINRLCTFSIEENFSDAKDYHLNENWIQLLSVYHNLICRGVPTYPTEEIERLLLLESSKVIPIIEQEDDRKIAFRDQLNGVQKEQWLQTLITAFTATDFRCNDSYGTESDEEKEFIRCLSDKLGNSVFQTIECQRPISTMIESTEKDEFHDQRVDFSLETKNTKIVIEIDGAQHLEEKQQRLDKKRQLSLEKNHWTVLRIPAWKVREKQFSDVLEPILSAYFSDPLLLETNTSFNQSINKSQVSRTALQLILTPIAIARLQWALIWSFMNGILSFNNPIIKIAIIEEDIPCAFLSVRDFIHTLTKLKDLAGIELSIPKFEFEIIKNNDFESFPEWENALPEENYISLYVSKNHEINKTLQKQFDLVIDISTLGVGKKIPSFNPGRNNFIKIDSVFSPRGKSTRFYSAPPIPYDIEGEKTDCLEYFLQWIFRYKKFLDGQLKILSRTLTNKDVIGLLPTGGGKSLCYQLSALLQPGITLIVDPLISLMHDQVENLKQLQIDAIANISSDLTTKERNAAIDKMVQNNIIMLFISPERLQIHSFREKLSEVCLYTSIPYVVIDEAHCVSEWGHDFRPSYLRLASNARTLCQYKGSKPSIIALTGTASWIVLSDMQREIEVYEDEAIVTPNTFDRHELEYEVIKCDTDEKISKITAKILELPSKFNTSRDLFFTNENAGIIFCPHVNGRHGIIEVAIKLNQRLSDFIHDITTYSGSTPKNQDTHTWKQIKKENQKAFKENEAQLMVSTKAFGMGIDKPNIRYTIHYNIPTSLESFYQEAGRAGRDKRRAYCIIIFSENSTYWRQINTTDLSIEELKVMNEKISYSKQDDISRMLYLHGTSWMGIENELAEIMNVFNKKIMPATENLLNNESVKFLLPFNYVSTLNENWRVTTEKTLYRLSILGLVSDYTLDHNTKQFEVEAIRRTDEFIINSLLDYFSRYKPSEYRNIASQRIDSSKGDSIIEKCLRVMLEFVYSEIEKKRRRAIFQMAEVADTSLEDDLFRTQLLDYLEKSEFTQQLAETATKFEPMEWIEIALLVNDIDSARHLLGGCRRALESYPDHPGLLLLSSFSRIMIPKLSSDIALDEFKRAVKLIKNISQNQDLPEILIRLLEIIDKNRPPLVDAFGYAILNEFPNRDMARSILKYVNVESESGGSALKILLNSTLEKTELVRLHILGVD